MTVESNEVPFLVIEDEEQPTRRGIEIRVWDGADPTRLINVVARRWDPTYLEEHNRDGGGSFKIRVDDQAIIDTPDLLNEGNLVEHIVDGRTVGWWEIAKKVRKTVPAGEHSGEWYEVSGPGLYGALRHAVLYPAGGGAREASDTRTFNFASPTGSWYDPDEWTTPVIVGSAWPGYPIPRTEENPQGWPVTSSWIWDRDTALGAPEGDVYFRKTFTTTARHNCRIYAAFDDIGAVYVDGQPLMTVTEFAAWQRIFTVDFTLPAGDHVIAIHGRNRSNDSPAGVNVALVRMPDDEDALSDSHRLAWTGQPGWVCQGYPDPAPGWSSGLVMETLFAEAAARGVRMTTWLTIDFDGVNDSYGSPWTDFLDWSWSVGTSYRDIVAEFNGTVADAWVDPDRVLRMAPVRGFDRSIQNAGRPPVMLARGFNVTGAETESEAEITNAVLMKTKDGWVEEYDLGTSVADYGRREGYLSAVEASEKGVARRLAEQVFAKYARPRRSPTVKIFAEDGHTPWVDFGVGDWVLAPDDDSPNDLVKRRIMSIACGEDDAGNVVYECEIDSIAEDRDERIARWLNAIGKGTFAGGVAGATGDTGGGQPLGTSPMAATGTPGPQGIPGPPGVTWRGTWSAATEYDATDAVAYDGRAWVAEQPSVNVTPEEGDYWTLLADRGAQGAPGIVYRGTWASGTAYVTGDVVTYLDATWIANSASTGDEPGVAATWDAWGVGGGGGGGLSPRAEVTYTTASLAKNATENGTVDLGETFQVLKIATDRACRIRLYSSVAARAADAARPITADPDPATDHGLILEAALYGSLTAVLLTPTVVGANWDDPVTSNAPIAIENLSDTTGPVAVTITFVRQQ